MATRTRIQDLELVIALSEERNLSQAAKRVGMTQPAMSKRLQVIERRLQLKLFQTHHTGADITESGRSFAEYAQQSVNLFHRGIHEARQARHACVSRLRVGVSPFQPAHLVEMLRTMELRLYRNLVIEVESAFSCDLLRKLQQRDVDVALVASPPLMPSISTWPWSGSSQLASNFKRVDLPAPLWPTTAMSSFFSTINVVGKSPFFSA